MSAGALAVARAMLACYPETGDGGLSDVEGARQGWGRCLGAVAQALVSSGDLPEVERMQFFREAGLAIYD